VTTTPELPALPEAVAIGKRSKDDGSLFDEIAPTGWHTHKARLKELSDDPWIEKGRAELVSLYTAEQMHAYARAYAAARGQEDAARLDWLESNEADTFRTSSSNEFCVQIDGGMRQWFAPTLRAAIDAAMKENDRG
jgi:hypothetical protein